MLKKALELCKEHKLDDGPIGNLAKLLIGLTNANWNLSFDAEFQSIVFELVRGEKILSLVWDPNQKRIIWFTQNKWKVISGFDPNNEQLEKFIKNL